MVSSKMSFLSYMATGVKHLNTKTTDHTSDPVQLTAFWVSVCNLYIIKSCLQIKHIILDILDL